MNLSRDERAIERTKAEITERRTDSPCLFDEAKSLAPPLVRARRRLERLLERQAESPNPERAYHIRDAEAEVTRLEEIAATEAK